MIAVSYCPDLNRIECTGHAGYAQKGSDILCASVTALCYTLAFSSERAGAGTELVYREGHIGVGCRPRAGYKAVTRLVYGIFAEGLRKIAEDYPAYVSFEVS